MHKNIKNVILIASACSLLCACGSVHRQDSAPRNIPKNINFNKIPDAVPKAEPHSKYGNPASYVVFGKRYHTLKSAKGYEKRGIASWYGTKFHEQRTSSGEPYNMFAMTAANKELPLPTYVQVTNLENGKKIIVKVNDRGPFKDNRIIDLSYAAARKLGVTAKGTAYVDVKAIDPKQYYANRHEATKANTRLESPNNPKLYLQVASFNEAANAEHLEAQLKKMLRKPVRIEQAENHYRVQVGPLASVEQSDAVTHELQANGYRSPLTVIR